MNWRQRWFLTVSWYFLEAKGGRERSGTNMAGGNFRWLELMDARLSAALSFVISGCLKYFMIMIIIYFIFLSGEKEVVGSRPDQCKGSLSGHHGQGPGHSGLEGCDPKYEFY